jgi:HKD family nuclease
MKFLKSPTEIESAIKHLTRKCRQLRWAVAWASHDFPLFHLLKENETKIRQLTVGIHFYQTHPDFIGAFLNHDAVSFVMNPDGVFHPKLYLFEFERGKWECVTGSPNFTHGGFSANAEVAVHFTNLDLEGAAAYSEITTALDGFATFGKKLTESDLEAYRAIWKRQQRLLKPLSGRYGLPPKKRLKRSPLDVPLFVSQWPQYFQSVNDDKEHTILGRLAIMEEARRLFSTHKHFHEMADDARRGIAGLEESTNLPWLWFGSMRGHFSFPNAVTDNTKAISEALDEIPHTGHVTETCFRHYVRIISAAFTKPGVGTASRLLALKRPDYFVCLSKKNRRQLCKEFDISTSVDQHDYWDKIVAPIIDSNWWNSPEPTDELERRIWRCRAAFLDVRFYEP